MRSANLPDAEKSTNLKEAELHLTLAKHKRAVYNSECMKAAEELKLNPVSISSMELPVNLLVQETVEQLVEKPRLQLP